MASDGFYVKGTFNLLRGQIRDQRNAARQSFSLAAFV